MRKHLGLFTVILISFFAIKPLLHTGYFPVHDSLQVERIYEMAQALRDGHFPVRWVKDLGYGYGYPLFNFYAPLPYYVGALFYLLGFNLITATKIMFGLGILLAGVSMYFLGRAIWGEWGGVLSAVLYQYLPYHAVQIYVRGSVGEYWAYALLPLLALALMKRRIFLGGIVYAAILLSHNISAMLVTAFLFILVFIYNGLLLLKRRFQFSIFNFQFSILILGLALSAFFWLPAFVEKDFTQVEKVISGGSYYADHFVQLSQLWNSTWGYGGSAPPDKIDGMSFKLGKLHILLAVAASIVVIHKRKKIPPIFYILYSIFFFSIFMLLPVSDMIWRSIPLLQYSQFPWRFLMYAGFSLSLLGGGVLSIFQRKAWLIKATVVAVASMLVIVNVRSLPNKLEITHFKPKEFFPAREGDFINDYNLHWIDSKRSDEYLPKSFTLPLDESMIALTRIPQKYSRQIKISKNKTHVVVFSTNFWEETVLPINIAYFPGWTVYIDGDKTKVNIIERGFEIIIPPGRHEVMIRFEDRPIRRVGNIVSLVAILLLGGTYARRYRHSGL